MVRPRGWGRRGWRDLRRTSRYRPGARIGARVGRSVGRWVFRSFAGRSCDRWAIGRAVGSRRGPRSAGRPGCARRGLRGRERRVGDALALVRARRLRRFSVRPRAVRVTAHRCALLRRRRAAAAPASKLQRRHLRSVDGHERFGRDCRARTARAAPARYCAAPTRWCCSASRPRPARSRFGPRGALVQRAPESRRDQRVVAPCTTSTGSLTLPIARGESKRCVISGPIGSQPQLHAVEHVGDRREGAFDDQPLRIVDLAGQLHRDRAAERVAEDVAVATGVRSPSQRPGGARVFVRRSASDGSSSVLRAEAAVVDRQHREAELAHLRGCGTRCAPRPGARRAGTAAPARRRRGASATARAADRPAAASAMRARSRRRPCRRRRLAGGRRRRTLPARRRPGRSTCAAARRARRSPPAGRSDDDEGGPAPADAYVGAMRSQISDKGR